jgi:ubiquinone/menaquinone biosynthesis C-methylase UbiE
MSHAEYESEIRSSEAESENIQALRDLFTCRDSVDAWHHERMLQFVSPMIATYPSAHWLTIGDGGADSWILRNNGAKAVTASSISDARLKKAKELGFLHDIEVRALNAERLELPNASFDFVLCTQAYHHLRRAPLAFYEFMRVSRIGFVLIEPTEGPTRPLDALRALAKMLLRRRRPINDLFEPVGNFIYRLSERDIFRMLAAVQIRWFAIKPFNTFYLQRLASQRRDSLQARLMFQIGIGVQDIVSSCRLMSPGSCVVFVPSSRLAESAQGALRAANFRIVSIPDNPYTAINHDEARINKIQS